jgi:hypothetical protein
MRGLQLGQLNDMDGEPPKQDFGSFRAQRAANFLDFVSTFSCGNMEAPKSRFSIKTNLKDTLFCQLPEAPAVNSIFILEILR